MSACRVLVPLGFLVFAPGVQAADTPLGGDALVEVRPELGVSVVALLLLPVALGALAFSVRRWTAWSVGFVGVAAAAHVASSVLPGGFHVPALFVAVPAATLALLAAKRSFVALAANGFATAYLAILLGVDLLHWLRSGHLYASGVIGGAGVSDALLWVPVMAAVLGLAVGVALWPEGPKQHDVAGGDRSPNQGLVQG